MPSVSVLDEFVSRPARTLTLSRARRLYDRVLGLSPPSYRIIHVAGTNGKGSVSGKIGSCLSGSGYTVGLYTSPHIFSIHDRITINSQPITHTHLVQYLSDIRLHHDPPDDPLTTFEALTVTALKYFHDQQVDFAVIEAGLGGSLDATNIVQPCVTVITSIGRDHCEYLGNTLPDICRHKAGIIKPRIPIVTGPTVPVDIIDPIATAHQAAHYHISPDAAYLASYDEENIAIASQALDLVHVTVDREHLRYVPPCRFQSIPYHGRTVILDAAHNQAAFTALTDRLRAAGTRRLHVVLGMSSDKMPADLAISAFTSLSPISINIVAAKGNARAWNPLHIAPPADDDAGRRHVVRCVSGGDIRSTLARVVLADSAPGDVVVVCGSFYIMREAHQYLNDDVTTRPPSSGQHDRADGDGDRDDIAALYDACIRPT